MSTVRVLFETKRVVPSSGELVVRSIALHAKHGMLVVTVSARVPASHWARYNLSQKHAFFTALRIGVDVETAEEARAAAEPVIELYRLKWRMT